MQAEAAAKGRAQQVCLDAHRKHRSPPDLLLKHSPVNLPTIAERTQPTQGTARQAPWARGGNVFRGDFKGVLQARQALRESVSCLTGEGEEEGAGVLTKGPKTSLSSKLTAIDSVLWSIYDQYYFSIRSQEVNVIPMQTCEQHKPWRDERYDHWVFLSLEAS
jgi:hypothetical protein